MQSSRIEAVDHVELEARAGQEEELRWFYGSLGELKEVAPEPHTPCDICFRSKHVELRIRLTGKPKVDDMQSRLTLRVSDLALAARLLDERKIPFSRMNGLLFTDRFLEVLDPSGYRITLRRDWPQSPF